MILIDRVRPALDGAVERGMESLAETFSSMVAAAPPARLEAVMASPARRLILEAIFWAMPRQFDPSRAQGMRTGVRWRVSSRHGEQVDTYDLLIENSRCRVRRGDGGDPPQLTITVDGAEFLRIIAGRSDPIRAYFERRIAISGDIMTAGKLASLFRIPGTPAPRRAA